MTGAPSSVEIREIDTPGVKVRPGRYKFTYENRRKAWKQAPSLRFFRARNDAAVAWNFAQKFPFHARQTFEYVLTFEYGESGGAGEGVMDENFETPDLSEFLSSCAKQFCPWCGKPMGRNPMGRPRVFCSDRCRWAYNSWRHRKRMKEKENGNTNPKEHTGDGTETGSIQPEKKAETG